MSLPEREDYTPCGPSVNFSGYMVVGQFGRPGGLRMLDRSGIVGT
jgi:hypothetical protein